MKNLPAKVIALGIVLLVLLSASTLYLFKEYQKVQKILQNPSEMAKRETEELVHKVGTLIELPKNEEPSIATVADKSKLKNQPFFAQAANGDKVIFYIKAKKAIIYRPSTNKIIEVGTLNVDKTKQGTPTPSPAQQQQLQQFPTFTPAPAR